MTMTALRSRQCETPEIGPGTPCWILAAGQATRFKQKLHVKVEGKSLVEWAITFALANGWSPEVITTQSYPGTAGALDGRTGIVLFGDNFYAGPVHTPSRAMFTTSVRDCTGLAVVAGDKIVEKPHAFKGVHTCFTGYCYVDRWVDLNLSARGEYEITDLLNKIDARPEPLSCRWEHLSVYEDLGRVTTYVKHHCGQGGREEGSS